MCVWRERTRGEGEGGSVCAQCARTYTHFQKLTLTARGEKGRVERGATSTLTLWEALEKGGKAVSVRTEARALMEG